MARDAEITRAREMAGDLVGMLDELAENLHHNESLHLHDVTEDVRDCGYCWLRAGRALGIMARRFGGEPVLFRKRGVESTTFHGPLMGIAATIQPGDVLTLTVEGVSSDYEVFGGKVRYRDA